MSKNTKTSWKGPPSRHLWILCLFPVAEINTRSPNVAHNLVESSRGWGGGSGVGPAENASPFFAAFRDSRKTLEKMAQPSHPCLKPGLHNRQFFFCLQFLPLDSGVSPLLAPQNPSDRQTIQHVYWLQSLLSMSICKKCPSQPFLSPEWRLVVSTNLAFYFINWAACDEPSS